MSFPLVDRGFFPPGNCIVTGESNGPFFDFGDRRPMGSRVYVGADVIEACARELGMVHKDEAHEPQDDPEQAAKAAAWDAYNGKEASVA